MKINSFYPVIMTNEVMECAEFFRKYFNFKTSFDSDWYISLIDENKNEIAFMKYSHETIPAGFRALQSGLILNFEVENVDTVYEFLNKELGDRIRLDIKTEEFGQRHFIIEAPNKLLVDVIQVIKPSEEFKQNYQGNHY